MTEKQMLFCDEYLKNGCNATQAYLKVYKNVKNREVAKKAGSRLLTFVDVKNYINERLEAIKDENTADISEVMQYLTSVMRGTSKSEEVVVLGTGMGTTEMAKIDKSPSERDKLKAAELLGKSFGMFTDKVEQQLDTDINIRIDYGED